VTNGGGNVVANGRMSYDPWGMSRNADGSADTTCSKPGQWPTTRGFTGHEEMPSMCLINMNARIYDPGLGRFMSADPSTQTVYDLQVLNRYSYVLNNPLAFTDPTGLKISGIWGIVGDVAGIALMFVGLPELEIAADLVSLGGATTAYAAANATVFGVINAGIAGGVAGAIGTGKLSGTVLGAVQGAAMAGLAPQAGGAVNSALNLTAASDAGRMIASGMIGGLFSVAGGGHFASGFLAAGVGALPGPNFGDAIANGVTSSVLGGFASVLGGGKFANGALTAAFAYAASAMVSQSENPSTTQNDVCDYSVSCSYGNIGLEGVTKVADVTVNDFYNSVGGAGHVGIGVNTPKTQGYYPADESLETKILQGLGFNVPGAVKYDDLKLPHYTHIIHTSPQQDKAVQTYIDQTKAHPGNYNLYNRNCAVFCEGAINAGGMKAPSTMFPNRLYDILNK